MACLAGLLGWAALPPRDGLLLDHSASDPVPGVPRWIRPHVIGLGVNNDGSASIAEERMAVAAEIHVLIEQIDRCFALGVDREIVHVAGMMPVGILQPMLLAVGIKVRPGRFEVWPLALGDRMKMNCMLPGRHVIERKPQVHALSGRLHHGPTNRLSRSILDGNLDIIFRHAERAQRQDGGRQYERITQSSSHTPYYSHSEKP